MIAPDGLKILDDCVLCPVKTVRPLLQPANARCAAT